MRVRDRLEVRAGRARALRTRVGMPCARVHGILTYTAASPPTSMAYDRTTGSCLPAHAGDAADPTRRRPRDYAHDDARDRWPTATAPRSRSHRGVHRGRGWLGARPAQGPQAPSTGRPRRSACRDEALRAYCVHGIDLARLSRWVNR